MIAVRRGTRTYYYKTYRDADGRVARKYLGTGDSGRRAADAEAAQRLERRHTWNQLRREMLAVEAHGRCLKAFTDRCEALLSAALLAAGYYRHHGQWRRRASNDRSR